ncbi:MAG: 3-oxoacyl-ACP reductase FabG [Clostridia bacterium]|jgi:3-oxoacyl-[acyl-carrier protein] reductase|nr:oxidoreductase short chain dehydrogenase/reductase family protein [Clostridium sp. CAG:571]HJJ06586.1 3-oxoacyl-ACP reductase FabG [Clostridiaceae bacterium]
MERRVVVITGASNGIGEGIVRYLSKYDYNIVLNYNTSKDKALKIQNEIFEKFGKQIEIFKADISKRKEVKELVEFCIEKFKRIDVLINNAGISQIKPFTDITDEDWNNIIQVNLTSAFYTSQECLRYMIKEKNGCIINISSIWGKTGASCEVHYSVSKAGLDGLTKSLAKELGPSNIRVNGIAPGIIDTRMNNDLTKEDIESIKEEIPLEKIGNVVDIAKCVKWLIEDEYTTGQIIGINGGWNI